MCVRSADGRGGEGANAMAVVRRVRRKRMERCIISYY
jgi:hypothetical protein